MTTFFYLLTLVFWTYEITVASRAIKHLQFLTNLANAANRDMWRNDKEFALQGCLWISLQILYLIWSLLGLALSSQWKLFGMLFLISFGKVALIKISGNTTWRSIIITTDAISTALVLTIIFMNKFHPGVLPW
jgi:hypothetical protein